MNMNTKTLLSLAISSILLAACGGGGDSSTESADHQEPNIIDDQGTNGNNGSQPVDPVPEIEEEIVLDGSIDNADLNCLLDGAKSYTGNGDSISASYDAFKGFLGLKAVATPFYLNSGVFGFLGQDVYAFDAYIGINEGDTEWRSTVPEDILSIKIRTNESGAEQDIVYTNFLNTGNGVPSQRESEKKLIQTTFEPCHGYSQVSMNAPFKPYKKVNISQRYNPVTKQLFVSYQDMNDSNVASYSPKYFIIYDVMDVSGKFMSDYIPSQILDLARYGVSRFTEYSKITRFPEGSIMLKTNSVLIPEQFTGFRMDAIEYFSETFASLDAFKSFVGALGASSSTLSFSNPPLDLHYSNVASKGDYIRTFDFDRSEAMFVHGGKYHAANHQPLMVYKPNFHIDTTEIGRSYYNEKAGAALHALMEKEIFDDR